VEFALPQAQTPANGEPHQAYQQAAPRSGVDLIRNELLGLRAALDEAKFGVVLLDAELRAQFINRAFRKMWRLPDSKAASRPAFVALLYHGRDTRAYELPESELGAYVAERVAEVKAGNPAPRDIRLASGEVLRFQCTGLPSGGRVLSYTSVTDIVRHSDELEVLRAALDNVEPGIILLDAQFCAQFINTAARQLAGISPEQAGRKPHFSQLMNDTRLTGAFDLSAPDLDALIAQRIAVVKAGDPTPVDLRRADGRIMRAQCAILPDGGRMLTYTDVTDLVRHAEALERLATTDELTGIWNRRHFLALAEGPWARFVRERAPLAVLVLDLDVFKSINDRFGHDVGDAVIAHAARLCGRFKRETDILARFGGEEFVLLMPDTRGSDAVAFAEALRQRFEAEPLPAGAELLRITTSIGVAEADATMASLGDLLKRADQALYDAKRDGRNRVCTRLPVPPAARKPAAA